MEFVYEKGHTVKKFPFIVKYAPYNFEDGEVLKVVISVPKRKIKKATGRNRVRRQIKEAFRLNKFQLKSTLKKTNQSLALFLIYTGQEKPDYSIIEKKIKLILNELTNRVSSSSKK